MSPEPVLREFWYDLIYQRVKFDTIARGIGPDGKVEYRLVRIKCPRQQCRAVPQSKHVSGEKGQACVNMQPSVKGRPWAGDFYIYLQDDSYQKAVDRMNEGRSREGDWDIRKILIYGVGAFVAIAIAVGLIGGA